MAKAANSTFEAPSSGGGLRDRKKAKRRKDILRAAARLFAENGIDNTTLADIAEAIAVSPPTISNYFGSKDNILSALIFEGAAEKQHEHRESIRPTGAPFQDILGDLLIELTVNTMKIAGKRVWRYAEARCIREPDTEFGRLFSRSDNALRHVISRFLDDYDVALQSGLEPNSDFLGDIFFDRWTRLYFGYIKNDQMTMEAHAAQIRAEVATLVQLLFDASFTATSPLKHKAKA